MSPEAIQLVRIIERSRVPLEDEKRAQVSLSEALTRAGIAHEREVALSPADIVDFMVDGIAIEMKIKGPRMAIYRQLQRYAEHARVRELVLCTARCMGLPDQINGKPAAVASLSKGWL